MNSEALKEKFLINYKKFFKMYDKVFSIPLGICRGGSDLINVGITMIQKVPLRIYIGYSLLDGGPDRVRLDNNVLFDEITFYNVVDSDFQNVSVYQYLPYAYKIQELCNMYLKKNNISGKYVIGFLCESNRDVDLGFDACIFLLVSTFLYSLHNKIHLIESQHTYVNDISMVQYNESYSYVHIQTIALQLIHDSIAFNSHKSYNYLFGLLHSSYDPIVSYSIKQQGLKSVFPLRLNVQDVYSVNFSTIVDINTQGVFSPFVYGIFYVPGAIFPFDQTPYHPVKSNIINVYDLFADFVTQQIPYRNHELINNLPDHELLQNSDHVLYFREMIKFLYVLGEAYQHHNEYVGFYKIVQSLQILTYNIVAINMNHFNVSLAPLAKDYLFSSTLSDLMFVHTSYFLNNTLLFFSHGHEQHNYHLHQFKEKGGLKFEIVYCNLHDGLENNGLSYEQDLLSGLTKSSVSNKELFVLEIIGDAPCYGSYSDLIQKNVDVIFDLVRNKVIVGNVYLTSCDIHSQVGLIDLFLQFKKVDFYSIMNVDLPKSTYSSNKSELLSKIIRPFNTIIRNKLGKSITLQVAGSVSYFAIECNIKEVTIGYIYRN